MDNTAENHSDIEAALRRLTPRAPGPHCHARIAAALDAPEKRSLAFPRIIAWAAGIAAAAACAVLVIANAERRENPAPGGPALPGTAVAVSTPAQPPVAAAAVIDAAPRPAVSDAERGNVRHRAVSSIEPLDLRRTPDGRLFRPYRVRYISTVSQQDGTVVPQGGNVRRDRAVPAEEVHFVGFDMI